MIALLVIFHRNTTSDSVDSQERRFCDYAELPIIESGSNPIFAKEGNNSVSGAGYFG